MKLVPSIKNSLTKLDRLNPDLADELEKLPEIRNFRTNSSRIALSNLMKIYQFAPDRLDRIFKAMDDIGMPAQRKYCSPLQALFWLIQDEKMSVPGRLLGLKIEKRTGKKGDYRRHLIIELEFRNEQNDSNELYQHHTLEKILNSAWNEESLLMQRSNIHQIINRIQTQSEAEEYALLVKRHDDLQFQSYIMDDFMRKRKIFDVNGLATNRNCNRSIPLEGILGTVKLRT